MIKVFKYFQFIRIVPLADGVILQQYTLQEFDINAAKLDKLVTDEFIHLFLLASPIEIISLGPQASYLSSAVSFDGRN
jgi:hypothetical protein